MADKHADTATLTKFHIPVDDADATAIIMKLKELSELAKQSYATPKLLNSLCVQHWRRLKKPRIRFLESDDPDQNLIDWLTAMAQELFASALNCALGRP